MGFIEFLNQRYIEHFVGQVNRSPYGSYKGPDVTRIARQRYQATDPETPYTPKPKQQGS